MGFDNSRIAIDVDPRDQRMTGTTWGDGFNPGIYFDVPYMTEIAPNLWQGGCAQGLVLPRFISHMLSLYWVENYTIEHRLRTHRTVKMYDSMDQATDQVDRWARWVNARRKTGQVLVHCQAGLNRSSLVVARALMYEGMPAADAIALLREKRSPACLCNESFERYLLSI